MNSESFIDFLEARGAANPPRLRYREGEDFALRQRRFRRELESLRNPVPERVDPDARVVESMRLDDHTRHLLRIPVTRFSTLVAYLLVPHVDEGEVRPGLIALHGHTPGGIDSMCGGA